MITQFQLKLLPDHTCRPRSEWGYCLYAALLKLAPSDFADTLHQDAMTPTSQYLTCHGQELLWTVSLFGEPVEQILGPILERVTELSLSQQQIHLQVAERTVRQIPDTAALLQQAANDSTYRLQIHTPAAFKSQKHYVNLPTTHLILQNLLRKWNSCFPQTALVSGDGTDLDCLAAGLDCLDFQLSSQDYYLKGHPISGFTGTLTLEHHLKGQEKQSADTLLLFSQYAGIGIKTALGMGGVSLD